MVNKIVFILICVFISNFVSAEVIPDAAHQKILDIAMKNFWGKVRLKDGSYVKPASEQEKTTLPIAFTDASKVIQTGELSSLADWCDLDWQGNYKNLTKSARASGLSGKQVAFIGLLHGISMGIVDSALKEKKCSQDQKKNIESQLKETIKKPIDFGSSLKSS